MLATLSLVIRHEVLARRGETIYMNGFVGDIASIGKEEMFPKNPLALFWW